MTAPSWSVPSARHRFCARFRPVFASNRLGQRLVALTPPLDLVTEAVVLQSNVTLLGLMAPGRIDVAVRAARIEDVVKVLAVVRAGRVGIDLADDLVVLVDVDREPVAEMALAGLLGPGRVDVLLMPFRGLPIGRHRALLNQFLLVVAVVLPWRRPQRLTADCNEPLLGQQRGDAVEQGRRTRFTDPVLDVPHSGSIRDVRRVPLCAQALSACSSCGRATPSIRLRGCIGASMQGCAYRFGRIRPTPARRISRAPGDVVDLRRQRPKASVRFNLGQCVELLKVVFVGEQVGLAGQGNRTFMS